MLKTVSKYISIVLVLFSCNNHKESITLEIISNRAFANQLNFEDLGKSDFWDRTKVHNIIQFKFYNGTDKTQIINSLCFNNSGIGCSSINSFPAPFTGLSLSNLFIVDSDGKMPKRSGASSSLSDDFLKYLSFRDSIAHNHYGKVGYEKNDKYFTNYNLLHDQNIITIRPKETLYYEAYFDLPINEPSQEHSSEFIELKSDKEYWLSLLFLCDSVGLKSNLNKNQLLNFNANNHNFYHGKIKSKNSIPIIIKD